MNKLFTIGVTLLVTTSSYALDTTNIFEGDAMCVKSTMINGLDIDTSMVLASYERLLQVGKIGGASDYKDYYYANFKKTENGLTLSVLEGYLDDKLKENNFSKVTNQDGTVIYGLAQNNFFGGLSMLTRNDGLNKVIVFDEKSEEIIRIDACVEIESIPAADERLFNKKIDNAGKNFFGY